MANRAETFNPRAYADVPLYNIQAVAAATGVPSITLRSWERRYGIPEPKRDPKGYRLYSERDIAVTRWLRDRVQQGIGISRAVNMLRVLQSGDLAPEPPGTYDFASLKRRLIDAIQRLDDVSVDQVIGEALVVASVEEVSLHLLQATLYEVGEQWAGGKLSVTSEHVGTGLVRSHLAQLARLSPAPYRNARVMVGTAPGDLHDVGALMLTLFLRRRGFDVIYVGANVEAESFIADAVRLQPAAVCLSATTIETAEALRAIYERLIPDFHGIAAFGGKVFNDNPGLADHIPGVFLGENAATATACLEDHLHAETGSIDT